jgi:hypothetical protein
VALDVPAEIVLAVEAVAAQGAWVSTTVSSDGGRGFGGRGGLVDDDTARGARG